MVVALGARATQVRYPTGQIRVSHPRGLLTTWLRSCMLVVDDGNNPLQCMCCDCGGCEDWKA